MRAQLRHPVCRTLWFALVFAATAQYAGAEKLSCLQETIRMDQNGGAAVTWKFSCTHDSIREVNLPWNFSKKSGISPAFAVHHAGEGTKHGTAELLSNESVFFVHVTFDGMVSGKEWELSFSIPDFQKFEEQKPLEFGNRLLKYRFINTQLSEIANFSTEIILPDGYVITSVDETIPKLTEENPEPPTQLSTEGKNVSIILKASKLALGEQALVKLQCKPAAKSPILGIGLLCIGVLYLIFFRDLIQKPKDVAVADGQNNNEAKLPAKFL